MAKAFTFATRIKVNMQKPVLVIKLGSAVITNSEGFIDKKIIKKVAREIAQLSEHYRVALVSSGAVGSGKAFIKDYKGTLIERKAAAAIGNPLLIQNWHHSFYKHGLTVAQALCERHHFSNRSQFLQLRETFNAFWENNILPVVNENDLVSNIELKFSDNDELATLIAVGFDADTLIICTSAGGFMDDEKNIIPQVEVIDETILGYVRTEKSALGLGGMLSKLTFTRLAVTLGIKVVITGLKGKQPFRAALDGQAGSSFQPKASNFKARQKWLASGSITLGSIGLDAGAAKAVLARKSLLTVGISKVDGKFSAGEVVQLIDPAGEIMGVAKAKLSSADIEANRSSKSVMAAHADDIVLF
jgi:glutamate 5-kinase